MRFLVTGGTGFIGGNLTREFLARGADFVSPEAHSVQPKAEVFVTGQEAGHVPKSAYYLGADFANLDWKKLGALDAVFHEAAINDTTVTDRALMFKVNFEDSKKLFESAVAHGVKKIIYASSTAVYGNLPTPYREDGPIEPLNVYAESKAAQDEFAMELAAARPDILIVGLRYCNVYGPGEGLKGKRATMIWQIAKQMKSGNPKIFKFGEQKRDYIYVKDAVRANVLALNAKESAIVNCGSGRATSFNDIIAILNSVLGIARTAEYIENPYAAHYQSHTECDMSLAKEKLGFVPEFDIERGIADYYASGFLVYTERSRSV